MLLANGVAVAEGLVDALVQRFSQTEFEFLRAQTNAPLPPVAWASATSYDESRFVSQKDTSKSLEFSEWSVSEGALLPLPIGNRDLAFVGQWVSRTTFRLKDSNFDDLNVLSVAVPIGWARQTSAQWQIAAFVAPLGHYSRDEWYWEALGGVFARYLRSDRVAWLFGAYFDVGSAEDFYTPYLGAIWILNQRWTISAVLPWPGVIYAPGPNTSFRLGVTPSGTSWSVDAGGTRPHVSFGAWNLGISGERRVFRNLWVGAEAGFSGIRGLSVIDGRWQSLETHLDGTGYVSLKVNLRPSPRSPGS